MIKRNRLFNFFDSDEMFYFLDHAQDFGAFVVFHALADFAESECVQISALLLVGTNTAFHLGDFDYCHFA